MKIVSRKKPVFDRQEAEAFAIFAVGHLASKDGALLRFADLSGLGLEEIKGMLTDGDFLGAVLDYVLSDDALVRDISAAADLPPETVLQARRRLPGYSPDGTI